MTISEIAKMAQVSTATVSRYLNDGYVSDEKRDRIRKVIEETGYIPSAQAQMLRTRKSNVIGVILPKIDSASVSRMTAGISEVLRCNGYQMLMADTGNDPDKEIEYLNTFSNNQVDGVILVATVLTKKHEKLIRSMQIPVVVLGQQTGYTSCIYHNDYIAAKQVSGLLMQHQRKHPAYIGVTMKDIACGKHRYDGFCDSLKELGITFALDHAVLGEFSMQSGYDGAKQLLKKYPKTDAIFCATDTIALGALKFLQESGKIVPQQVAVTGIGHGSISEMIHPSLTTVHFYYKTSGIEAAKALVELINHPGTPLKQLELGFELRDNQTT